MPLCIRVGNENVSLLDSMALKSVEKCQYIPARINGVKVVARAARCFYFEHLTEKPKKRNKHIMDCCRQ